MDSKESETTFFGANSSKISLLAYTAHPLAKIKWYVSGTHFKKIIFYFITKVTYRDFKT